MQKSVSVAVSAGIVSMAWFLVARLMKSRPPRVAVSPTPTAPAESPKHPGEIRAICVFCGSREGKKAEYCAAARELGGLFVRENITLVYGGGTIGVMGALAHAVSSAGGHVIGVIPAALAPREVCGSLVGDTRIVNDMHTRKAMMARESDAFVALPGGYGTFEELFEVITWCQLGIHEKPIGLLNIAGFFDPFLELVKHATSEGFISEAMSKLFVSASTPEELLEKLRVSRPKGELRWLTPKQI